MFQIQTIDDKYLPIDTKTFANLTDAVSAIKDITPDIILHLEGDHGRPDGESMPVWITAEVQEGNFWRWSIYPR